MAPRAFEPSSRPLCAATYFAAGIVLFVVLCAHAASDDSRPSLADGPPHGDARRPETDDELRYWLTNMLVDHHFTVAEASAATGLSADEIAAAVERWSIMKPLHRPTENSPAVLKLLQYPGGRHPRIGFLDGAIRPQRETKFSAFLPWDADQYVVVDIPEAIWIAKGEGRELLYLAHTHVPTMWTRQGISLEPLEWIRSDDDSLRIERQLPNGVVFGAAVVPTRDAVRMHLWITNGTDKTLRGLTVQNCVMLKGATEFNSLNNDNKLFRDPFVGCRNEGGDRWIITAWEHCMRAWGNAPCPCMHSDPQFPDCAPGETQRLDGWLSFYEGTDFDSELRRIARLNWRDGAKSKD